MLLGNALFRLIGTPEEIVQLSYKYLFFTAISLLFVSISNAISASLRSYGRTTEGHDHGDCCQYIQYRVQFYFHLWLFWCARTRDSWGSTINHAHAFYDDDWSHLFYSEKLIGLSIFKLEFHITYMQKILKVGVPSALENMTYNVLQFVILSFVNKLGTEMITARTYINTMLSYIYLFSAAFASANAIITGLLYW